MLVLLLLALALNLYSPAAPDSYTLEYTELSVGGLHGSATYEVAGDQVEILRFDAERNVVEAVTRTLSDAERQDAALLAGEAMRFRQPGMCTDVPILTIAFHDEDPPQTNYASVCGDPSPFTRLQDLLDGK